MRSLYIHIPFCKQKCIYCDFNSYAGKEKCFDSYFEALSSELKNVINENHGNKFKTVYFGGGTPSIPPSKYIINVLKMISCDGEITIEVNPDSATIDKLKEYRKAGINRLSIGLQSYNDRLLKIIGRIHTKDEFDKAYKNARKAGFRNINVDLMIGLPNQSLDDVKDSLDYIISINPEHISCYSLITHDELENRYTKPFKEDLPNDDTERKMYYLVCEKLKNAGYIQYEISNFAKPYYRAKHNMCYWNQGEYYGIGAGASSYIDGIRYKNIDDLEKYISLEYEECKIVEEKQSLEDKLREYVILKLRLLDGLKIDAFNKRFKTDFYKKFEKEIKKLEKLELIKVFTNRVKLTKKGLDFANIVWEEFV